MSHGKTQRARVTICPAGKENCGRAEKEQTTNAGSDNPVIPGTIGLSENILNASDKTEILLRREYGHEIKRNW